MVVLRSLGTLCLLVFGLAQAAQPPVRFNRDIRPIMSDTCFRCHGPDKRSRMAGLRLDLREEAIQTRKSGRTPIVPGNPEKSAIIQRVFATDSRRIMPPVYAHKELTPAQKETLRRWVAEGAVYEGHWAYQPVKRPAVPAAPSGTNPIDAFIRERLASAGLQPSPEADRRTLLRRATLDLTGLPPTEAEYRAFLADKAPGAWERVVDRLLSSPRFAEMRAMRWLDAVRYADSAGFHGDNLWPVWPYRDWVLRAFRENMPFDRFTREQIAGDLIPNATLDQRIASAYNRLNRASAEGGIQAKEYLAKYGADRVRTTATAWLGSTMGCAECHDHKFDPFTSRDFYSMKAFFADIKETGLIPDRGAKAWGSRLFLPTPAQKARLETLTTTVEAARKSLRTRAEAANDQRLAWEERILADHAAGRLAWQYQRPLTARSAKGATLTIYNQEPLDFNFYLNGSLASERKPGGGLIVASGANPDNDTYTVTLQPGAGSWTSLGLEIQQDESLPGTRLGRGADRFVLSELEATVTEPGAPPRRLPLALATSTGFGEAGDMPALCAIDANPQTGWAVSFGEHRNAFLDVRFAARVATTPGSTVTLTLRQDSAYRRATIGRFRVALSAGEFSWPETGESGAKRRAQSSANQEMATLNVPVDRGLPPDLLAALNTEEAERTADQRALVADAFAWSTPRFQPDIIRLAKLETEQSLLQAAIPRVLVTERQRPRVTRILPRANWMDDTNEIVQPAIPGFLGKLNTGTRRATRLDLANWIVSPSNPLTARVFVNRLWREYFGTGLSKVMEDLGSQGEWPTHPELLDWLAAEFMNPSTPGARPWDMKHMVRLIVTSHTYRQVSTSTPQLDERDPDNRLLARQSRFRVDAEVVHDIALSVSGLLANRFGGPSVRPYEPEGYLAAMNFPKREYSASRGADLHRRALYTEWQRTFLHPSLLTFDAPTREECSVNRVNSNTPLQSLVLLNDPIFVEAARVFAQGVMATPARTFDARLTDAFERALNRAPSPEERRILADLHQKAQTHFRASSADAREFLGIGEAPLPPTVDRTELAAMTTVTRAILNLHETITRN